MVLLLVFMQLTRDLFAIAKFLLLDTGHYKITLVLYLVSVFVCSDENQFELVDEKVEKLFDFQLKESLCRAHKKRLFRVSIEFCSYFY